MERNGNWILVRGKLFGDHKGYIVGTDGSGSLTGMRFETELPVSKADLQS